jgi:hypothetical protein
MMRNEKPQTIEMMVHSSVEDILSTLSLLYESCESVLSKKRSATKIKKEKEKRNKKKYI